MNLAGVVAAFLPFCPGVAAFAQEAPKPEPAIRVTLKDGIRFKSEDGNLDATLGGYFALHYRFFPNRPNDGTRISPDLFWEDFDNLISFATGPSRNHFFGGVVRFQLEF